MNIEFSFTSFEDFDPLPKSKSNMLLGILPDALRTRGISVVYFNSIKMGAMDSYICTKNLHKGLADRIQTFPYTKQVIIHLFDNMGSSQYLIQDRARNEASFTSDVRGYVPSKTQINPNCPLSHTLTSPIPISAITNLIQFPKITILDHEMLFVDNYIYYCSLTRGCNSGVISILVYIPFDLQNLNEGVEFLVNLCQAIRTTLIS